MPAGSAERAWRVPAGSAGGGSGAAPPSNGTTDSDASESSGPSWEVRRLSRLQSAPDTDPRGPLGQTPAPHRPALTALPPLFG